MLFCEEINCIEEGFLVGGPLGGKVHPSTLRSVVFAVTLAITPAPDEAAEEG